MLAAATSLRRRPPLAKAKESRARSRRPSRLSSQVASMASSSGKVIAVFFRDRSPRLTAARAARLSTVRTAGCSQGFGTCLRRCALTEDKEEEGQVTGRKGCRAVGAGGQPCLKRRQGDRGSLS